jgi:hypothetical protein
MVAKARESPNDKLLVDLIVTLGVNICSDILSLDLCRILAAKFETIVMKHMFTLIVTDDFICSYLMPLCDHTYDALTVEDYAWRLLKQKPALIADDDYLNKLYDSLDNNSPSYRVL